MRVASVAFRRWFRTTAEARASVLSRMAGILRLSTLELVAWMVFELDRAWDEVDEGQYASILAYIGIGKDEGAPSSTRASTG